MSCSRSALRRAVSAAICLGVSPFAHAAVVHDSNLTWRTLTSAHFAVHYHDGEEVRARQVVGLAERVHNRLSAVFNWIPLERTEIVLTDEYDVSNGYTSVFPANRMELLLTPPDGLNSLEDNAGWLETVITHEYTHVLHLDKVRGLPAHLRNVFGRFFLLFPNALEPTWLIEGMAVYYETDRARGIGRGQSSYFDMLMRMEVAGGGPKPLRQVNQPMDTWPQGYVPYLYGVQFENFVAQRNGEDSIQKWVTNYSDRIIPFRIITNSKVSYGKGLAGMWDEFVKDRRDHYGAQISTIRNGGEAAGERVTHEGYYASGARGLEDGTVFWTRFDGKNDPALMVLRPGVAAPERLAKVHYGARIAVHPQAGVLLAQPEVCRNARYYYDLYRVDPQTGSTDRLTHCARYRAAAWSPDGQRIVAVHQELGQSALDILDREGKQIERIWSGAADEVVGDLDWSPDGTAVVASVWRRDTGWNIELLTLADRRWRMLTKDSAIEAQPQFTRDGKAVLFSSDHGGVYNLRRVHIADGRVETLSNVVGGAFYPTEAGADNGIYYLGYGSDGFDLYRLGVPIARTTPAAAPGASGQALPPAPIPADLQVSDYSPYNGLRPRWWFPHLVVESGRTEIGAQTSGWDALTRHIYYLDAAYDVTNSSPVGSIDYIYDRWYPILKFGGSRWNLLERNSDDEVTRVRHSDTLQAEAVFPLLSYDSRWSLHAAALETREADARLLRGATAEPADHDSLAGLALVFDSSKRFPLSISRSHGREVHLVAEDSDAIKRSDYTGRIYTFDWREFVPLGSEHVLAVRLVEGWGTDAPRPFKLGGNAGAAQTPPLLGSTLLQTPFNVRQYALRGYPEGRGELEGRRMQLATLEWRFPVRRIERGIMIPPMALQQVYGSAFVDTGATWHQGSSPDHYRSGIGLEANADVTLFYSVPFTLRLGVARGVNNGGETQAYLRIGSSF